jgi:hypothetical protein
MEFCETGTAHFEEHHVSKEAGPCLSDALGKRWANWNPWPVPASQLLLYSQNGCYISPWLHCTCSHEDLWEWFIFGPLRKSLRGWRYVARAVEGLPSKHEVLSSNHSTTKKKKKRRRRKGKCLPTQLATSISQRGLVWTGGGLKW